MRGFLFICLLLLFAPYSYAQTATSAKYTTPLEVVLYDYEQLAAKGGWAKFPVGKKIRVGYSDKRIPIVRQILTTMGDYNDPQNINNETLDEQLAEAVKKFQIRHGLDPDGAIGAKTQATLAVPVEYRIAQMKASLERMHEIPDFGDGRYVLVNVAGFYLKAVEKNQTAITSKIIDGNLKNHTPLFQSEIVEVIFNPQWHVPERIAREETVRKQRENPNYLTHDNFMVTNRKGEIINPNNVDWNSSEPLHFRYTQRSGDGNALGKIKFNIPNIYGVYLHYTSSPKLFQKAERAFSHGCMRVELARDLAYFVMDGMDGWDKTKIDKSYDGDATKYIATPAHIPVFVGYFTAWVDEDSKQPHFNSDIYGLDKKRISELMGHLLQQK